MAEPKQQVLFETGAPEQTAETTDGFPTDLASIMRRVEAVQPVAYARTRNFIDGDVTRLSPYISRGVISMRTVLESVISRGFNPNRIKKFIQELAWREYYQRTWQALGDAIDDDLRTPQQNVTNEAMPAAVIDAETGIDAVDDAIRELYSTGYMHNHVRMYTASIACNIGGSHWSQPARWMYYHLIDGDWASNALSWQWVAGTSSNKKYFANQENVNRFCYTSQKGTFLDRSYAELEDMNVPGELRETRTPDLTVDLPDIERPSVDPSLPTLVYTTYNLDPEWHAGEPANRILLLEPSHFAKYPVSADVLKFVRRVANNIVGIKVFVGEFGELRKECGEGEVFFKEHPFSRHFVGTEEPREWMFDVEGSFRSFFAFWKKCEPQLSRYI